MRAVALFSIFLLSSPALAQTIYKWKDEKGNWRFSDTAPSTTQGVEQRTLPRSMPEQLPKEELCGPFKIGETRTFKAFKPSPDLPHLQTSDFQMRLVEKTDAYSTFSWHLVVKNTAIEREGVRGTVSWKDCDGFMLAEAELTPTAVIAGGEATITGKKTIFGPAALKVGRFGASFSGQHPVRTEKEVKQTESYKKPDVRVYYTQLQNTGSEIYFVGEVANVGLAVARNVKVNFVIKDERGLERPKDIAEVSPPDLKPGQTGIFRKRVFFLSDTRGYGWYSDAQWSE